MLPVLTAGTKWNWVMLDGAMAPGGCAAAPWGSESSPGGSACPATCCRGKMLLWIMFSLACSRHAALQPLV